jgi:hypothetical protein
MKIEIMNGVELTTDHPQSHYGIPVLLIDGKAFGPCDQAPEKMQLAGGSAATAGYWLAWLLNGDDDTTPEMVDAAKSFLSQWPDETTRPGLDEVQA